MINNITIISMFVPIVFSFLLFGGLIVVYRRKMGIVFKPFILGVVGFIVFSQVLEKALHVVVLTCFPNYVDHPVWFGLYGGLAAGIFEELGRFILFTWLLKKYHEYKSGISFGIGWAGMEAVLLTLTMVVPNIIFAFMMNAGTFESNLGNQIPAETVQTLKNGVLSHGVSYYLLACVERFFAVFLQIFLSLFVLLGVTKKKFSFVLSAIAIHALFDFPLVFFQTGHIKQLWLIELYIAVIGCLSFFFIKKLESVFNNLISNKKGR